MHPSRIYGCMHRSNQTLHGREGLEGLTLRFQNIKRGLGWAVISEGLASQNPHYWNRLRRHKKKDVLQNEEFNNTPPLPSICHFLATPWKEVTKLQKEMKKYRVLRLFSGETIVSNKLYVLKTLFYSSSHIRVWQIFKWFCLQRQGLRVENILRCRFFPTHTISKGCSGAEKEIRSKIDFFCSFLVDLLPEQ